jgi:hypothetical protein
VLPSTTLEAMGLIALGETFGSCLQTGRVYSGIRRPLRNVVTISW